MLFYIYENDNIIIISNIIVKMDQMIAMNELGFNIKFLNFFLTGVKN